MDKAELAQMLYETLERQQESLVERFNTEGRTSVYHENRLVSSIKDTVDTLIKLGILEDEASADTQITVNVSEMLPKADLLNERNV